MIKCQLDYKCPLCSNTDFYMSPVGEKTVSKDIVYSLHQFQLVCKKCYKTYLLDYKIEAV